MDEIFLQNCWKYKLIDFQHLITSKGEKVIVHQVGKHNTDEGPDFLHAKIEIEGVLWFGSVEIHTKLSDWHLHKHDQNKNYETVILHLVYKNNLDQEINSIPVVELKKYIPQTIIDEYNYWKAFTEGFIPCEKDFPLVDLTFKNLFLESIYLERLEEKTKLIEKELAQNQYNWEFVFFTHFASAMGLKINSEAFGNLASSMPFSLIQKAAKNQWELEALLFGQAGFLEENLEDEYHQKLKEIYGYYKHKHQLTPINKEQFKFFRLRPQGFPTIRIAQLAAIYLKKESIFSHLIQLKTLEEYYSFFETIKPSKYWQNHYQFGKESESISNKNLSQSKIDLLLINAILPFKFAHEKILGEAQYDEVLETIASIGSENNSIIEKYQKLGLKTNNAMQTQALLHLNKHYCKRKKCLNCSIGIEILRKK